ncbi:Mismatch repair protein msh3 [Coemansia sp. RSA 1646]|nr:Mismatch repair protein msh3 [Coemansia sp. RSA 1646]
MSSSKRVQASLSSFFKPKQQKQQVTTASVSASVSDISLSQSPPPVRTRQNVSELRSDNSTKRRRVLSSEECSLGDKDDEGYVEDRVDSASSKQSKPPKGDKTSFTFSKRRSTGQSAGETLVKSVSDTTNMMQRLRMRIAGTKESEGSSAASQTLAPAGTLDQTSIQLVQRKKGTKYTPLEIQVLEAKEQHPDILLAVEVGYKYRFFGEDARIASRVLGIMCTTANNFYNASIPTPRLMVHVRRLVHAGYKVGVMRQAETAALKAISDNKNAPFSRKLADVYTSGTLVEEVGDSPHSESSSEKYLMCITEGPIESNDKRVNIGMLAVQITTGDIVYDCFEDGRTSNSEQSAIALKELLKPGGRIAGGHSSHVKDGDGSLFSIMDFTRSQFGRRMLRRWIAHPLVSQERLMGRIEAVEFLKNAMEDSEGNNVGNSLSSHEPKQVLARMHNKIGQLVDIERGLCRIHYGQASPQELLRILRSLMAAVSLVPVDVEISEPRLLAETLDPDIWSNDLREAVLSWTNQIDYQSAKSGRKNTLFSRGPLYDMLQECHCRVEQVDSELAASIGHVRSVLKDESIEFKSISGIDYLIDIKNTKAKTVPLDWVKVSGTKSNSRFHTPYIINKLAERERCREALQQSAKNAYKTFLAGISEKYSELRQLVGSLATLDALFSLAMLARREGYCKPEFVNTTENDCASINLADAVNPVLGSTAVTYVPNVISLGDPDKDSNAPQAMILTGPNAGGKSSLIRTVALTSIMAQCGSFVPASHARLSIIDAIFTRMGASDNLMAGESTFMVEMRETQELMRQATPRSLAILDELGRGTSTHDGAAIAYAVLDHLVRKGVLTFFVTHYAHLVDAFAANKAVRSCHMSYIERSRIIAAKTTDSGSETSTETETTCSDITFLYKLAEGASADSFGLNVARIAGLPEPLLLRAKERASWMRAEIESKWASKHARDLRHAVSQAYAAST